MLSVTFRLPPVGPWECSVWDSNRLRKWQWFPPRGRTSRNIKLKCLSNLIFRLTKNTEIETKRHIDSEKGSKGLCRPPKQQWPIIPYTEKAFSSCIRSLRIRRLYLVHIIAIKIYLVIAVNWLPHRNTGSLFGNRLAFLQFRPEAEIPVSCRLTFSSSPAKRCTNNEIKGVIVNCHIHYTP